MPNCTCAASSFNKVVGCDSLIASVLDATTIELCSVVVVVLCTVIVASPGDGDVGVDEDDSVVEEGDTLLDAGVNVEVEVIVLV